MSQLLSHQINTQEIEALVSNMKKRIQHEGDTENSTSKERLEMLDDLKQCELGKFLLKNQGLNGYWTHYILTRPWQKQKTKLKNKTEQFILDNAPTSIATQQRFIHFLKENQKLVKNGACLASLPCGMLGELLYLDFSKIKDFKLIGIDLDEKTFEDAKSLAKKQSLLEKTEFIQKNAWDLTVNEEFDLISSNGLNIYEPDDDKVTQLYQKLYHALKPGGTLVTSFLTPPPTVTDSCEWNFSKINQDDLKKQKILFLDILQAKWTCYRSTEQTKKQLASVGFQNMTFIDDEAKLFPTVIAKKIK